MSTYRAFQVTGHRQFELVERELIGPQPGHVRFRCTVAGCAIAICSPLTVCAPTRASRWYPDMRSSASSTPSERASPDGASVTALALVFWAAPAACVSGAAAETSSTAKINLGRARPKTEDTPKWLCPRHRPRTHSRRPAVDGRITAAVRRHHHV